MKTSNKVQTQRLQLKIIIVIYHSDQKQNYIEFDKVQLSYKFNNFAVKTIFKIYYNQMQMARRTAYSPLKTVQKILQKGPQDPRDEMIQKLKDQLIKVRGRQRQLALCQNVLRQIIQKTRLLQAEKVKSDEEGKYALDQTIKQINQLKKEIQLLKNQLKNYHAELTEVEQEENGLKRTLNSKNVEIEKLRKESYYLMDQNEKLVGQTQKLNSQYEEAAYELKRIQQRIRDYESRNSDINKKVSQVKTYINELSSQNQGLKDKLKSYETENTGITDDLQRKQGKIDHLQQIYSQRHDQIKNLVQNFVQLQHQNQKSLKQTKHKLNLLKMQNQKFTQLNSAIAKIQKRTIQEQKQSALVKDELNELDKVNRQFIQNNQQLKKDLTNCQQHLQNLLKNNSLLHLELENMVRQDEEGMNILRRKKIMPSLQNYQSMRSSRQSFKSNVRY